MSSNGDSPARGLKNVLSIKRQSRDDVASINGDSRSPRRNSNDSSLSRLKTMVTNIRAGDDDDDLSDGRRSAKGLLSGFGKLKDKARRKSQAIEVQEDFRGRDTEPKLPVSNTPLNEYSKAHDDETASLTSESDADGISVKPPLINHPSHAGYLTSTSPQVQAAIVSPDLPAVSRLSSPTKSKPLPTTSLNAPRSRDSSISPSRTNDYAVVKNNQSSALLSPIVASQQSGSPRNSSPSSQRQSPQVSGTIAARRQSRGSELVQLPALQLAGGQTNRSNDTIPSIVTVPDTPPHSASPPTGSIPARSASIKEDTTHKPLIVKNMVSHRRVRSDIPPSSKLSQSMAPPLTPLEEAKTPVGSRNTSGASAGAGFFSSVFSVAQNAANTFTNTLQSTARPKTSASGKVSAGQADTSEQEEDTQEETAPETARPLAIETIGSGNLSLDHLGITVDQPESNNSPAPSISHSNEDVGRSRSSTVIHHEQVSAKAEDVSAARAVSAAYSTNGTVHEAVTPMADDTHISKGRPASVADIASPTITNGSILDDNTNLTRTGSIRSKLDRRRKRHRNSSGTTVGTAIAASHSALLASTANKFSGFTKANAKRNKDFHALFRNVPDDDDLIEDYSCALQRDIILAGRIYISEGHICFSSNILGWVTSLVISFDEIVSVEKESTAMLFANAIAIQMLHARHTFRSLLSRDATYDLIINIWRLNHPGLESSENGLKLVTGTGSKTQRIMNGSDHGSDESGNSHEFSDESESENSRSFLDSAEVSIAGDEGLSRKVSLAANVSANQNNNGGSANGTPSEKLANSVASLEDFPGPSVHVPTECNDASTHLDKVLKDEIVTAPLGKVYSLVFGPASNTFMSRFLQDEIKVTDLHMEDNKGLSEHRLTRSYTYIKPLYNSIGPRTTKCIITEKLDFLDLERAVTVSVTTQTPDVPSGNLFSTKTKYCFMWGPNNTTRIVMTYMIDWTGKSWLKGAIERGATDGQTTYANDLIRVLKAGLSPRGRSGTQGIRGKKLRKRRSDADTSKPTDKKVADWGPFQPLHDTYTRISRLTRLLFAPHSIIGILLLLLAVSWFGNSGSRYSPSIFSSPRGKTPQSSRIAAWEELWLSEEEDLWEWLEDRAGLADGLAFPPRLLQKASSKDNSASSSVSGHLRKRTLNKKDINWAIRLTEQRLASMKQKLNTVPNGEGGTGRTTPAAADGEAAEITDEEAADLERLLNGVVGPPR